MEQLILQYLIQEPRINAGKKKGIILLHGVGSNENALFNFANQFPPDFYIISPRGQFTLDVGRYAWYQVDFSTGNPIINAQQEASSREVIIAFIEQVKKKYDLKEVYLGGFSQGAIMSYSIGLTNPGALKGIIALSGRILNEIKPLVTSQHNWQQLKVFVGHGKFDNVLPARYAREAKGYIEQLQISLSYHEYDIGHGIDGNVINDLNAWLA